VYVEGAALTEHAVVIAGAGPTGMMLAAELAIAGVDVVVAERRATQHLAASRAGGLHARTIEVVDPRGVAERFVAAGRTHPNVGFAYVPLPVDDFPTRHNYLLALWQREFEQILAGWLGELGVRIAYGREVVDFAQDDRGVDIRLSDGARVRAQYLVGCDGGRSAVRRLAAIDFPGLDASASWLIAEVDLDTQPEIGVRREGGGIGPVDRVHGGNPYHVVLKEPRVEYEHEPVRRDLEDALVAAYGTDFGMHEPKWISRFTDATRQAASYRAGRVLLAGDAAHVHPPQGGQGLNVGVQDAVNLGWKLAQVVDGGSPENLLDTYHAERHPVGARVLRSTEAMVALSTPDDRHDALRATVRELLAMDEPRRHLAGMLSGLDVRYDLGEGNPLLGRGVPDLDLHTADGPTRVFTLLHGARPVLLNLGADRAFDVGPWPRVRRVDARCDEPWELPVIGAVPAPEAVAIRPDGYVVWAGEIADPALPRALTNWFGGSAAGSA
jgi:2-polyprenyl-6-methoxyphenol hydroxylase-like FAD-dependent oxidoreductase